MSDPQITSLSNPRIKDLVRLRNHRGPAAESEILIDGVREIARATDAGVEPVETYYCAEYATEPDAMELLARLRKKGSQVIDTSAAVFDKIRYGDRTGGIVAVAARPRRTLADIDPRKATLVCVIEGLEKPGNLGAILRSADGAGVGALLVIDPVIDTYNPNAIRASIGTIFSVAVIELDAASAFEWLTKNKFKLIATRPQSSQRYTDADLTGNTAVILGSESKGLSNFWNRPEVASVSIPMAGIADSLNVATTASIMFYEAARQRSKKSGV